MESHASDLNPVAVLINKAQIEIPPRFANHSPVSQHHLFASDSSDWKGARGLAVDIRHYGQWVRNEAEKRIGKFYPKARLVDGREATVIAWIWARTVKCPNPTCGAQMPLVRSFWLSKKKGKEAWAAPAIDQSTRPPTLRYGIQHGPGVPLPGTVNRNGATCLACGTPVPFDYVRKEGRAGRMGQQLMAIVAEGKKGREYLALTSQQLDTAMKAEPISDIPETDLPEKALSFRVQAYGMTRHCDLFTPANSSLSPPFPTSCARPVFACLPTLLPPRCLPMSER